MFHSVARSLPNPPGRPEREKHAYEKFSEAQKSYPGCRAARLVNVFESQPLCRCGPETRFRVLSFRHFSQCSQVREHAKSGQPEGLLTRSRGAVSYILLEKAKQSFAKIQVKKSQLPEFIPPPLQCRKRFPKPTANVICCRIV